MLSAEDMAEPWREHAACAGKPTEWFYPGRGEAFREAMALCAICPVQADCLAFALRVGENNGIWGGKSERARRRIRHYVPKHRDFPESETA